MFEDEWASKAADRWQQGWLWTSISDGVSGLQTSFNSSGLDMGEI
jgi:hypothetical protein